VGGIAAHAGEAASEAAGEKAVGEVVAGAAEKAGASCGLSFTANTEVLLAAGKAVPISTLTPGQKVLATNTVTGKTQAEAISAVLVNHDTDLYDLQVRAGTRTAVIRTSSNHPIWDQTTRRWVKAGALRYGMHLRIPPGATPPSSAAGPPRSPPAGCGTSPSPATTTSTSPPPQHQSSCTTVAKRHRISLLPVLDGVGRSIKQSVILECRPASHLTAPCRTWIGGVIRSRDTRTSSMYLLPVAEPGLLPSEMTQAAMSIRMIRRKIGVRTSIRRMVVIMTIERQTLKRERAADWPIFADLPLARNVYVLSVEIARQAQEPISLAVTHAAATVGSALSATFPGISSILLLAIGRATPVTAKLAALKAERSRLWTNLEDNGGKLPDGSRVEARIEYGDKSFGYVGNIAITWTDFSNAIELTRTLNAVCIGGEPARLFFREIAESNPYSPLAKTALLRASVQQIGDDSFVVRGFGGFDDRIVGVEVFSTEQQADLLERNISLAARDDPCGYVRGHGA
jgi:hypothetical protein